MCVCVCVCVCVCLPYSSARARRDTRSILKRSLTGFSLVFLLYYRLSYQG